MHAFSILSCLLFTSQWSTMAFLMIPAQHHLSSNSHRTQYASTGTTTLNLFGGGNKDKGNSGPGMMDQLAMFKKAQEIATKKRKLDEDLQKMTFTGTSSNNHVTVTMKYVPVTNPLDPNPEYESTNFDFDDDYYSAVTTDDLGKDIQDAITDGIEATNKMVAEKYSTLQSDLMEALGGKIPGL